MTAICYDRSMDRPRYWAPLALAGALLLAGMCLPAVGAASPAALPDSEQVDLLGAWDAADVDQLSLPELPFALAAAYAARPGTGRATMALILGARSASRQPDRSHPSRAPPFVPAA